MSENPEINEQEPLLIVQPKRGRGRPRKSCIETSKNINEANDEEPTSSLPKRRRGRPTKAEVKMRENVGINKTEPTSIQPKRGRGRPRKTDTARATETKNMTKHLKLKKRRGQAVKRMKYNKNSLIKKNKLITHKNTSKKLVTIKQTQWRMFDKILKHCAVSGCDSNSGDPRNKYSFHRLPSGSRRSIWKYFAGITSVGTKMEYICGKHFKPENYYSSGILRTTAIPQLHLPSDDQLSDNTYDDLIINPSNLTQKLHDTIQSLAFFKRRYIEKYIDLLTNLYIKHPSVYKMLEQPLGLLSPLQLKKQMYKSPINLIRCSNLINKKFLMMNDKDRVCFVTCVQIAIESKVFYSPESDKLIGLSLLHRKPRFAESVNILIAHGVYSDWHIPLDITFINNFYHKQNTKNWIEQTFKTYDILDIKGFAWCPNYTDYLDTAQLFATLEFLNPVLKTRQCHIFYDLQFLLKLLYFYLQTNSYCFGKLTANLDDLKEMFAIDSKRTYPLAPDLSAEDINISTFDQLTYNHIKNVFCEETVIALRTYTATKLIQAEGTAIFVENIGLLIKLFDSNDKLTNEETNSIAEKVQDFLKTIKYNKIKHFIDSLCYILNIFIKDRELFCKMSKYVLNNYIHTFVDNILNNSVDEKPTSMDIENAYRISYFENLLKPIMKNVNFHEALNIAQREFRKEPFCYVKTTEHIKLQVKLSDCKLYMLEREDRLLYVAGYILKKCYLYHGSCNTFKNYMDNYTDHEELLSKSISKEIDEGNCLTLKNSFIEFIEVLEMVFLGQFFKWATKEFFIKNLLTCSEMQAINFTSACACFPSSYARELFVGIRIDYVLTYNNMNDDVKYKVLQNVSL